MASARRRWATGILVMVTVRVMTRILYVRREELGPRASSSRATSDGSAPAATSWPTTASGTGKHSPRNPGQA